MHRALAHESTFWDAAIVLLLMIGFSSAALAWGWIISHPSSPIILRTLIGLIGIGGFTGFFLVLWGSFVEPKQIKVNTKSIHFEGLPDLIIAVVGDFHVGPYKGRGYLHRVVRQVNMLNPDVILIPGDFIYNHRSSVKGLEPLKNLDAALGVFAVLGNHDTGHMLERKNGRYIPYQMPDRSHDVIRTLEHLGITMLRNQHAVLTKNTLSFAIAGTDHCWMDSFDLTAAFNNLPNDMPVILLSHIPDVILHKKSARASLIVSGHTHGGQIRLPFLGSIYPIPDRLGKAFDQGLFQLDNGPILAITHGIGETMARARLFCPPEILLLKVQSK